MDLGRNRTSIPITNAVSSAGEVRGRLAQFKPARARAAAQCQSSVPKFKHKLLHVMHFGGNMWLATYLAAVVGGQATCDLWLGGMSSQKSATIQKFHDHGIIQRGKSSSIPSS